MPVDSVTYPGGRSFNRRNYDPATNPDGMANGGTDVNWFDMCQAHIDVGAAALDAATTAAGAATTATAAAAAAQSFAITSTTSASVLTIGVGAQSVAMADPLPLIPGTWVTVASNASPANYMIGLIASRVGTTLNITVPMGLSSAIGGAGTFGAWKVQSCGAPGATGGKGDKGDAGAAGLSTLADPRGQALLAHMSRIQSFLP